MLVIIGLESVTQSAFHANQITSRFFKDGTAITFVFCVHFIVFAVYYSTDQDLNAVVDEEV